MSRKRNCRRTPDEATAHEKAVRIRKMTDEQIVSYLNELHETAYQEGYERCETLWNGRETDGAEKHSAEAFLWYLQKNKIQGVGAVTINKLLKVAEENGYV